MSKTSNEISSFEMSGKSSKEIGNLMLLVDALVVYAEERRMYRCDNVGEPLNRRYYPAVSEWGNP